MPLEIVTKWQKCSQVYRNYKVAREKKEKAVVIVLFTYWSQIEEHRAEYS
jgi:hypothetical protein